MLRKYGEAADVTADRDAGFQMVLGGYSLESVREAFVRYLKTNREIPTPSDIVAIIDPWSKPLCGRVYQKLLNELKEKGQFALTNQEHEYIYRYEQQQISH